MTLEEKERRIEEIGGDWAELMRRSRELRDALSAAVMETTVAIDPHSPEGEAVHAELCHHDREHEHLLDKIIELAELRQQPNNLLCSVRKEWNPAVKFLKSADRK